MTSGSSRRSPWPRVLREATTGCTAPACAECAEARGLAAVVEALAAIWSDVSASAHRWHFVRDLLLRSGAPVSGDPAALRYALALETNGPLTAEDLERTIDGGLHAQQAGAVPGRDTVRCAGGGA